MWFTVKNCYQTNKLDLYRRIVELLHWKVGYSMKVKMIKEVKTTKGDVLALARVTLPCGEVVYVEYEQLNYDGEKIEMCNVPGGYTVIGKRNYNLINAAQVVRRLNRRQQLHGGYFGEGEREEAIKDFIEAESKRMFGGKA